jgi:hypothetical protein
MEPIGQGAWLHCAPVVSRTAAVCLVVTICNHMRGGLNGVESACLTDGPQNPVQSLVEFDGNSKSTLCLDRCISPISDSAGCMPSTPGSGHQFYPKATAGSHPFPADDRPRSTRPSSLWKVES